MSKPYVDPYAVLGLQRGAGTNEIKKAYFEQVRLHPPEREQEMFKRIRAAYEQLRDPEKRAETDMLLLNRRPPTKRKTTRPGKPDLAVHSEDVLSAARALTDLERTDWREHYHKVQI
jgi:curved DNA-binding protein CbpA